MTSLNRLLSLVEKKSLKAKKSRQPVPRPLWRRNYLMPQLEQLEEHINPNTNLSFTAGILTINVDTAGEVATLTRATGTTQPNQLQVSTTGATITADAATVTALQFLSSANPNTSNDANLTTDITKVLVTGPGAVVLGASNVLDSSWSLDVTASTFDLGGFNQTVNALNVTNNGTVTNTGGGTQLLTVTGGGSIGGAGNNGIVGTANELNLTISGTTTFFFINGTIDANTTTIDPGATFQIGTADSSGFAGPTNPIDNGTIIFGAPLTEGYSGISGTGQVIVRSGNTLNLLSNNSYSGGTTIDDGGKINVSNTGLPSGGDMKVDGTLDIRGNNITVGALTGSGIITNTSSDLKTVTVIGSGTFDGTIQNGTGGLALEINGTGTTETLTGNNTYSGGTTVTSGTLLVNNTTGSGTGSGAVVVNGGVLGGTGTISGTVTANSGSVAPGNSPGVLTTGDLDLESGSTFDIQIQDASSFDQTDVSGAVVINDATLNITAFGTPTINPGDQFVIINNDGTDPVTGTLFHNLGEGALISTDFLGSGLPARLTYKGGSNKNDVVIIIEPTTVSITAATNGAEAGAVNGRFTVTQSALSLSDTVVSFSVGGTASSGVDFTPLSLSVTIAAGSTTAFIDVPVIDDRRLEGTENVTVTLTDVTSSDPIVILDSANAAAMLDILDNESATISFEADKSLSEGTAAPTVDVVMTISATGTGTTGLDTSVSIDVEDNGTGTATAGGVDYDFSAQTLTFSSGDFTTDTQQVTLSFNDDRLVESNETVDLVLTTNPSPNLDGLVAVTDSDHTLTIAENDSASVSIGTGTISLMEGGASANVTATLTLSTSGTGSEELAVDVSAKLPGNDDYFTVGGTFEAGTTTGATRSIIVISVDDQLVEATTETFSAEAITVTTTAADLSADGSRDISVKDNDSATVSISATGTNVKEGDPSQNVTATLHLVTSGAGVQKLAVDVSANLPGNDDYTSTAATFSAGALDGATASIAVSAVNDRFVEVSTETFDSQTLSATSTATVSASGSLTVQVADNDQAGVSIGEGTTTITEGGAGANITTTLTLFTDGTGTAKLATDIFVQLAGNGDFTSTVASFGDGALSGATADLTVTAVDDKRVESSTETFNDQAILGFSSANGFTSGSPDIAVVDNDSATVSIANGTINFTEGDASSVTATLTLNTSGTGTVGLDVSVSASLPGNADYTATAATFAAGDFSTTTADVIVSAIDDRRVEQTTETFADQALMVSTTANVTPSGKQTINVTDNDSASVSIAGGTTNVTEGGVSQNVAVTLALHTSGTAGPKQLDVSVSANLPGNADYSATAATFGVGSLDGGTANVVVSANNDILVEGTETFANQALSVTSTGGADATVDATSGTQTVVVTDNDTAAITFSSPTSAATEGGTDAIVGVTLTITANGVANTGTLTSAISVDLSGAGSGVDFTLPSSPMVTFGAGSASGSQNATVSAIDDTLVEGNELFTLSFNNLSDPTGQVTTSGTNTLTVIDNDTATLSIQATAVAPEQSGPKTVTVTLTTSDGAGGTATLAPGVTLTAEVIDPMTGTAQSSKDYTPFGTQTVSFGPGSTYGDTRNVILTPINDTLFEPNETVNLQLQSLNTTLDGQATLGNVNSIVTISSDDPPPKVSLMLSGSPFSEGGSKATVIVNLNTPSGLPTTVHLGFGGTAAFGSDYLASGTGVVIPAGQLSASITLTGLTDMLDEPDEKVVVSVTNITNGTAAPPQSVTATLTDKTGSLFAVAQGVGAVGRVNVYDNGALLRTFVPFVGWSGEIHVATSDVNGGGKKDIIVGAGAAGVGGHVKVFDGATGAELRSFLAFPGFGGDINMATGDVNGDGSADIIVGTATATSHVKVFDGKTGGLLQSFLAFPSTPGISVGSGDINHDGFADIIVGAAAGSSVVKVFDGRGAGQILGFEAFAGYTGGVNVAGGDLDGDGFAEVIVGSNANGHVKAFGANGGERLSFLAYPGFGGAVRVGSVDTNGDGRAEIITGTGPGAGPHVKRFEGQTLNLLSSFFAFDPSFTGGIFVG